MLNIFLAVCILVQQSCAQDAELIMVGALHRHGDRAPLVSTPVVNSSLYDEQWPLGTGELSTIGMGQLFDLGREFHEKYVATGFLPAQFRAKYYMGRTSDFHRTQQSAASLLYAIWPLGTGPSTELPQEFQSVPTSTVPRDEDTLLVARDLDPECPTYQSWLRSVQESDSWKQQAQENAELFSELTTITGIDVTMDNAISIADTLFCYDSHNYTSFNASREQKDRLNQLVEFIYKKSMVDLTLRLEISDWLTALKEALGRAADGTSSIKFNHWSAHDVTVMPALAALELWDGHIMPYAAHVVVELYKQQDGTFTVSVFVGQASSPSPGSLSAPVPLPFCQNFTSCPLANFTAFLESYSGARDMACGLSDSPDSNSKPQTGVYVLAVICAVLFVVAVYLGLQLRRSKSQIGLINVPPYSTLGGTK